MFMRYRCWQTFCDVVLIIGVTMGDMSCVISGLVLIQIAVDIEAYNKCETSLKYRYLQIITFIRQVVIFVYNRRANIFFKTMFPILGVSRILHLCFLSCIYRMVKWWHLYKLLFVLGNCNNILELVTII